MLGVCLGFLMDSEDARERERESCLCKGMVITRIICHSFLIDVGEERICFGKSGLPKS